MAKKKAGTKKKASNMKRTVKTRARNAASRKVKTSAAKRQVRKSTKPRRSTRKATVKASTRLIVVTSGERPVHEVASELREAGFTVDQVLDQINQVTGHASASAVRRLKGIRGVTDVSPEHPPFSIGPPDAPVQ